MPDAPPTLSRRERERQRRRQAMLDAARAVFAERGYAGATLDEIAERAEFGKGTLYNYFEGGKEEILFAVFDEVYDELSTLVDQFQTDAEHAPVRQAFHAFVHAALEFLPENEDLFLIALKESHQFVFGEDPEQAAYFYAQEERLVSTIAPVLERAMAEGEVRTLPVYPVARMLLENAKGVLLARTMRDAPARTHGTVLSDCKTDILDHPEQVAHMVTTLLFDGLTPPGA